MDCPTCKRDLPRWPVVSARIPAETFPVWDEAVRRVSQAVTLHDDPAIRNGQVVEILCAAYLAG